MTSRVVAADQADLRNIDLIDRLVEIAVERLAMEASWLSTFEDGDQIFDHLAGDAASFGLHVGDRAPLEGSYCDGVLKGELPCIIADTSRHEATASMAVTETLAVGSYVAVPVMRPDGDVLGMLGCVSRTAADHLDDDDVRSLERVAELIADIAGAENPARRRHRHIEARVRRTIDEERMVAHYQPITDVLTGEVSGVEALCRFEDAPSRPDIWFAEAASVGLGVELEIAAAEVALRGFEDLEPTMMMAINASPATIQDPRLATLIAAVDPERVILEVTEGAATSEYRTLATALRPLRDLGVRIAMDDVGAGFSGFAHVIALEPDLVKIDRSVIADIHCDHARQGLVGAIVRTARDIGALVVAEGVEQTAELDMLATLGIEHAQGFLMARPQPLPVPSDTGQVGTPDPIGRSMSAADGGDDAAAARFELTMQHAPIGMAILDLDGTFLHTNAALEELLGFAEAELRELTVQDVTHPTDIEVGADQYAMAFSGERTDLRFEKRYIRADKAVVWADVSVVVVRSARDHPLYLIAQIVDITDRRAREAESALRSETDALTGIANRGAVLAYLAQLQAQERTFGLIYGNLCGFASINDTFGEPAGDHVLIAVANRLQTVLRKEDLVARLGGDEFLVIVADARKRGLRTLATRAAEAVERPISFHPGSLNTTPSITFGVSHFDPSTDDSIKDALHRADADMYRIRGVERGASEPSDD